MDEHSWASMDEAKAYCHLVEGCDYIVYDTDSTGVETNIHLVATDSETLEAGNLRAIRKVNCGTWEMAFFF